MIILVVGRSFREVECRNKLPVGTCSTWRVMFMNSKQNSSTPSFIVIMYHMCLGNWKYIDNMNHLIDDTSFFFISYH